MDPEPDAPVELPGATTDMEAEYAELEEGRFQCELRDAVARCEQVYRGSEYSRALRHCCMALGRLC